SRAWPGPTPTHRIPSADSRRRIAQRSTQIWRERDVCGSPAQPAPSPAAAFDRAPIERIAPGRIVAVFGSVVGIPIAIAHVRAWHPVVGPVVGIVAGLPVVPGAWVVAELAAPGIKRRVEPVAVGV